MIPKQASLAIRSILQVNNRRYNVSSTVLNHHQGKYDDGADISSSNNSISTSSTSNYSNHHHHHYQGNKNKALICHSFCLSSNSNFYENNQTSQRFFHTESDYHNIADQTLHTIQDTLDFYFEDNASSFHSSTNAKNATPDISYSSGVLTIALSQGTWVLNKQTPNRQIWWSSPISGPRRYEYEEDTGKWIWTRLVDNGDASLLEDTSVTNQSLEKDQTQTTDGKESCQHVKYLGEALKQEMVELFHIEKGLEDLDDL
jgi:frataxin